MKQLFFGAWRRRSSFALFLATILIEGSLLSSCQKAVADKTIAEEFQTKTNQSKQSKGFGDYKGLDAETVWELQQAKIATAKYNNFDQAIADGYVDINVIVQEMGYHYLKMQHLDATFEYSRPEILVYNKEDNGRMKLVAVEYAVPLGLSAEAPAGFTGNNDLWSIYQGQLWTLHAWIWEFNPAGVFNPTNPNIHVH